jgi:hypothetical protein
MNNIHFLLIISLIFGILALILWIGRFFNEIDIIYPFLCNIVQFICIIFLYKINKNENKIHGNRS